MPIEEKPNITEVTLESLNVKVDELLKYQRRARKWAIVRLVYKTLLLLILVVIPVIFGYSLYKKFSTQVDTAKLGQQYEQLSQMLNAMNASTKSGSIDWKAILKNLTSK